MSREHILKIDTADVAYIIAALILLSKNKEYVADEATLKDIKDLIEVVNKSIGIK